MTTFHRQMATRFRPPLAAGLPMLLLVLLAAGCAGPGAAANRNGLVSSGGVSLCEIHLANGLDPAISDQSIHLNAARNEWVSCMVEIRGLARPNDHHAFRFNIVPLKQASGRGLITAEAFSAAQIVPIPLDLNRAGYIRHSGHLSGSKMAPRALLPLPMQNGAFDLAALRDPRDAANGQSRGEGVGEPLLLWIDLHVPAHAAAGNYAGALEIVSDHPSSPLASIPLKLRVDDFALPQQRQLILTAPIDWQDLRRLYPGVFETVTPRLLSRDDPACARALGIFDHLIELAQANRVQVTVPRLQPTVKWPLAGPPDVDWSDFDSLLAPWMDGRAFVDGCGLAFWPLPRIDSLDQYDQASRRQYWKNASDHFQHNGWLSRAPILFSTGSTSALSTEAEEILEDQPDVRVMLPIEQEDVELKGAARPHGIDPRSTARLLTAAPGLVHSPSSRTWPNDSPRPRAWLDVRRESAIPWLGVGAGENDIRALAWLAFLRDSRIVRLDRPLPSSDAIDEPEDPANPVWFYPGSWFGLDRPVPTIQLKWLRRAEEDFEYLHLAQQRNQTSAAMMIARLLTRPVELPAGQTPGPTDALWSIAPDPADWTGGRALLARSILASNRPATSSPAQPVINALALDLLRWAAPRQRAMILARTAQWTAEPPAHHAIDLHLGVDIYNASESRLAQNQLQWTDAEGQSHLPAGWQVHPQPVAVGDLGSFQVRRFDVPAQFGLSSIDAKDHRPLDLTFINGENHAASTLRFVLPVISTDRLDPGLNISDANLDDWKAADLIENGPMVRMLNRPAVQRQQIQYATHASQIYTGWGDECFYVAFRLRGVEPQSGRSRNFVQYQAGRAWGDDCCELLMQPIFDNNQTGPLLHIVCKPNGIWIERKTTADRSAGGWQAFQGAGIRYSGATTSTGVWTGEIAIPWQALTARTKGIPMLLRFNVSQHVAATGESASWAGPIDSGRDDALMGLLYVRQSAEH